VSQLSVGVVETFMAAFDGDDNVGGAGGGGTVVKL